MTIDPRRATVPLVAIVVLGAALCARGRAQDDPPSQRVLDACLDECSTRHRIGGAEPAGWSCDSPAERERWRGWCARADAERACSAACVERVRPMRDAEREAAAQAQRAEEERLRQQLEEQHARAAQFLERVRDEELARIRSREERRGGPPPARAECDPFADLAACDRACLGGDARACERSAQGRVRYTRPERDFATDEAEAAPWYSRACEAGSASGCAAMRFAVEYPESERYRGRALALAEHACQAGDGAACTLYGRIGYDMRFPEMPIPEVYAHWRRGCELGDPDGCMQLVRIPAINGFMRRDHGVPPDAQALVDRAYELAERACAADRTPSRLGCLTLAGMLAGRTGTTEDLERDATIRTDHARALEILDHACRAGNQQSCIWARFVRLAP